ncbi:MAG: hypothetical protein BGN85_14115 [Alphaproteobacteria bacterium 64-11]|nr:MAG: hypothetical protein BGN85_14115 [Alphaproteobacteria bacterium 64-11]
MIARWADVDKKSRAADLLPERDDQGRRAQGRMGPMMRRYRVLFLDRCQTVTREELIDARDDGAAVDRADSLAGTQAAEVWEGLRQVARLARGRPPPQPPYAY